MLLQIYILIATASNPYHLSDTLRSLAKCDLPSCLRSIFIIENGKVCGTEAVVRKFKEQLPIEYIFCPEFGKSNALNYGIAKYIPDDGFVLFSDDDVRFNPKWITSYKNYAFRYGHGHYFGSAFKVDYEEIPDSELVKYLPASAKGLDDSHYLSKTRTKFLGFNYGAFKIDIVNAGMFDPNLGPGSSLRATGQEFNMQNRLYERGCIPVFIPNNYVWHLVPKEKCNRNWLFQRKIKKGKKRSYTLNRNPYHMFIDIPVLVSNIFLSGICFIDKSLFYKYYFKCAYRLGLIMGVWNLRKLQNR